MNKLSLKKMLEYEARWWRILETSLAVLLLLMLSAAAVVALRYRVDLKSVVSFSALVVAYRVLKLADSNYGKVCQFIFDLHTPGDKVATGPDVAPACAAAAFRDPTAKVPRSLDPGVATGATAEPQCVDGGSGPREQPR
jgi:hypothetical protein